MRALLPSSVAVIDSWRRDRRRPARAEDWRAKELQFCCKGYVDNGA